MTPINHRLDNNNGVSILVVLLLGLLRLDRRLVWIDDEQRQHDGVHREQDAVLQGHLGVVDGEAVHQPRSGHEESGDDQREGQGADALFANDFRLKHA